MARTESNEFEMGKKAPDFTLQNAVNNQWISLNKARGKKGTVILFICNHCPFVIHVNEMLVSLAN
ncbi:MAG: redoxin domain-containing protein, partial [Polaribacter sp.]|nr:redoxin domain-containing protein [Polaribacter sp.]